MRRWFGKRQSSGDVELNFELALELDTIERVLRHCRADTRIVFGAPTRCPDCGDYGLVEGVDPLAAKVDNRCLTCGAVWVITRRALIASRRPAVVAALHALLEPVTTPPTPADTQPELDRITVAPVAAAELRPEPEDALHLLLVEDDPADAELVRTVFAPFEPTGVSLRHAETRTEAERVVSNSPDIDLVLLDLGLPDSSGLATLSRWNPSRPSPPVVVLSGNDNAALVDASRHFGAALYVHKRRLVDLAADHDSASDLVATLRTVSLTGVAPA